MQYGFVIDNRKCIGCHACTTACKSEHEVPVGVNRTFVKQVEKGEFPDTRRLFSVMRCNHCTDAPCIPICPTEALFKRDDGIVDFDKDRCIGCKSCMQACPYDALYIDPETSTAAKCNYCAHRIDIGLEPACVNVCPEHAIISGDMDDAQTEISQLLAREAVKVRKPEKGTQPNLFYIDADDNSLIPTSTKLSNSSLWGSQSLGVGHYAKQAEKYAYKNEDVVAEAMRLHRATIQNTSVKPKSIDALLSSTKQVYSTPDKGILWAWEVSAYILTKAISAGLILVVALLFFTGYKAESSALLVPATLVSLVFLMLTGLLLVMDLDQPKRFLYVLLRPQWKSWLVKGAYAITLFAVLLVCILINHVYGFFAGQDVLLALASVLAIVVAVYTAFLFGQAKGRDFWQSPSLILHMTLHAFMAGLAVVYLLNAVSADVVLDQDVLRFWLLGAIISNVVLVLIELWSSHSTTDSKMVVDMIKSGSYKIQFWIGAMVVGNVLPFLLLFTQAGDIGNAVACSFLLFGIYMINHIWVEAPQRIPLA